MKPYSRAALLLAAPLALAALAAPATAAEPQIALTGDISPAVGVSHRVGDLPAGQELHVAQAATDFMDGARAIGDEGPSPRMG